MFNCIAAACQQIHRQMHFTFVLSFNTIFISTRKTKNKNKNHVNDAFSLVFKHRKIYDQNRPIDFKLKNCLCLLWHFWIVCVHSMKDAHYVPKVKLHRLLFCLSCLYLSQILAADQRDFVISMHTARLNSVVYDYLFLWWMSAVAYFFPRILMSLVGGAQ